ncbi:Brp/Blh family beta-carotene 15,15'-dioxygenase [Dichotomicrobium thermohalophilum]|uniref:Brp/Blh family beta-carotene 15,15'-dioxygenase n=1 Tax=Dichotomicrobium thermohalophilum TaxID=933063 RepID=UPI0014751187|nr:Brp/Blh family beta-carotene 15,15'-dioxygenase [Dichotomicrobium thermohalophilum]
MDFPLLAATAMLLLGVPHGAFDVALAHRRWEIGTPPALACFLALYVGMAAAFAAIWFLLPQFALPVFIAMSGVHFAGDWRRDIPLLPRMVVGLALITAPALLHREPVTEIFAWLVPADVAVTTAEVMAAASIPLLQAAALVALVTAWSRPAAALEMAATLLLAVFAAPLVFFVSYWCGLHSARHVFSVQAELQPRTLSGLARLSLPYAPITIIGVMIAALLWPHLDLGRAVLAVLFVALAALTVPHMMLVDQFRPKRT